MMATQHRLVTFSRHPHKIEVQSRAIASARVAMFVAEAFTRDGERRVPVRRLGGGTVVVYASTEELAVTGVLQLLEPKFGNVQRAR